MPQGAAHEPPPDFAFPRGDLEPESGARLIADAMRRYSAPEFLRAHRPYEVQSHLLIPAGA